MDRSSLIRRMWVFALRVAPEAGFAVLLGAGLATGGQAALAGLPRLAEALLPGMEAQALPDDGAHGTARFVLPDGALTDGALAGAFSGHGPQVLYPVTERLRPEWLTLAVARQRGVPDLRAGLDDAPVPAPESVPQGPVMAICIDDLGEDLAGTGRAMALPDAVALSFLPYAPDTPFLARSAARQGHIVLAHVPMQALSPTRPGPMALENGMSDQEIARRLGWNLARVPGLVGINNHEGSRFTADAAALAPVMATLKARHLFFFDSRTGPRSQVAAAAARAGVSSAGRDVFLDDDRSPAAVRAQLTELVLRARRDGVAIAIGHPHDVTLTILAEWLKQDHGVRLVPLDEAIRLKAAKAAKFPASG